MTGIGIGIGVGLAATLLSGQFVPPSTNLRADFNPGKPATVTNVGGFASQVTNDSAGVTAALTQPTAANRPAVISANLNGFNILRFDGANDVMFTSVGAETNPSTLYLVMKMITWGANRYFIDGANVLGAAILMNGVTPAMVMTAGVERNSNTGLAVATWGIITGVFNGASSQLRVNRVAAVADGGLIGAGNPGGIVLGQAGNMVDPANCSNIDVARVLSYGAAHNTASQDAIIQGLGAQYGISV